MNRNAVGNRTEGIVGSDSHVVRLSHGCDFSSLQKPSTVAQVRLDDVTGPQFEKPPELMTRNKPLSGGDRHFYGAYRTSANASRFSGGTGSSQK